MKTRSYFYVAAIALLLATGGCEVFRGPDRQGEIRLSSQLFGSETYYIYGYSFEDGEFYKYPFKGEPVPDLINEAYRVIEGGKVTLLPGFNTPQQMNGFAKVGTFNSLEDAEDFYSEYTVIADDLQYETVSDTVELYQVWVQKTALGNFAKLLIRDIQNHESETGSLYNEVTIDFTYQPDGSASFAD